MTVEAFISKTNLPQFDRFVRLTNTQMKLGAGPNIIQEDTLNSQMHRMALLQKIDQRQSADLFEQSLLNLIMSGVRGLTK